MIRKMFSLILAVAMICSMSVVANAQEIKETESVENSIAAVYSNDSENEIMPCGLDVPAITAEWKLAGNPYPVTLTSVGSGKLYTNSVFRPDSNFSLSITIKVSAKKNTTNFTVGLYDVTAGKVVDSSVITISSLGTTAQTKTAKVSDLYPSHVYAFYFTSNGAVATGSATIFHNN